MESNTALAAFTTNAAAAGDQLHARIVEWGLAGLVIVLFFAYVIVSLGVRAYRETQGAKTQKGRESAEVDGLQQALDAAKGWQTLAQELSRAQAAWPVQLAAIIDENRKRFEETAARLLADAEARCEDQALKAEERFKANFDNARQTMSEDVHRIAEKLRELYVYSGERWAGNSPQPLPTAAELIGK